MKSWRILWLLLTLTLVLAACGGGSATTAEETDEASTEESSTEEASMEESSTEETSTEEASSEAAAAEGAATVAVADSPLGEILVDGEGLTLYRFLNDTEGVSNCSGECEATWPVLATEGEPQAGDGADAALLGTLEREDGTVQVTYADWPLYYFAADSAAGDTNGQGVGEVWYVVAPDGSTIEDDATAQVGPYGGGR
jgi:predicted lipoprotein with Yx(FWY)xxD motif